jgi:hypothetical protein
VELHARRRKLLSAIGVAQRFFDSAQRHVWRLVRGADSERRLVLALRVVEPAISLGKPAEIEMREVARPIVSGVGRSTLQFLTRAVVVQVQANPTHMEVRDRQVAVDIDRALIVVDGSLEELFDPRALTGIVRKVAAQIPIPPQLDVALLERPPDEVQHRVAREALQSYPHVPLSLDRLTCRHEHAGHNVIPASRDPGHALVTIARAERLGRFDVERRVLRPAIDDRVRHVGVQNGRRNQIDRVERRTRGLDRIGQRRLSTRR